MKALKIISLIVIITTFFGNNLFCQKDSAKVELSEEMKESSDYNYKLKYKYLNYNLIEEKNLFFINLFGINYSYGSGSSIHLVLSDNLNLFQMSIGFGYERKIQNKWSTGISHKFEIQRSGYYKAFGFGSDLYLRYFYNKNAAIRNKVSANNFNGNYLSLSISGIGYNSGDITLYDSEVETNEPLIANGFQYNPGLAVSWGINTRINKWLVFDFAPYAGFNFNKDRINYSIGINIKAALGVGF